MTKSIAWMAVAASAALLTACGGGGGSPGETNESYSIEVSAARTQLPINIAHAWPGLGGYSGVGVYAPYTTTVEVRAWAGDRPIPGTQDAFACVLGGGPGSNSGIGPGSSADLGVGMLFYLDGDDEHEDDEGVPLAYRGVTLDAIAGGNTFHFNAWDRAGTATISCTVTDPRDKRVYSDSVRIEVGGVSGQPASVRLMAEFPYYLGSKLNTNNVRNAVGLQASIMDDANQPVPDPRADNVRVRILDANPGNDQDYPASRGAQLMLGQQTGQTVYASTLDGVATMQLASGPETGSILLELTTDRLDNDVSNGIMDPISQLLAIPVVAGVSLEPLQLEVQAFDVARGENFAGLLEVQGGTPPYVWSLLQNDLPEDVVLDASGFITGVVLAPAGQYIAPVRVTDEYGDSMESVIMVNVTEQALAVESVSISATAGNSFAQALSATGGVPPYTWRASSDLRNVTVEEDGTLHGRLTDPGTHSVGVQVTDSLGDTANGTVSIEVTPKPED